MWEREPGFPSLILIILEQQVSLASAKAAYGRLLETVSPLTPTRFLKLDDVKLKAVGFSRQKTSYCRNLAMAIVGRRINLDTLDSMDDTTVRAELIKVKGIGPWTANIYLLMVLRRPDIWPSEDLALAVSVQRIKRLASRPTPDELDVGCGEDSSTVPEYFFHARNHSKKRIGTQVLFAFSGHALTLTRRHTGAA